MPSTNITWFQAQQACAGAGKRLLTNAEWQMAAAGTPDPEDSPGPNDCNTNSSGPSLAGSRTSCVSRWGVFDMVGNVLEWVADWGVPATQSEPLFDTYDYNGMGPSFLAPDVYPGPAALVRGGLFIDKRSAGVFAMYGVLPSGAGFGTGFRCAR